MKCNLLMFVLLFSCIIITAQVPEAFNYQAVVRNSSGNIVSNRQVKFRVSILTGSETGTTVYSETHSVTTNDFGLANLKIGTGNNKTGIFSPGGWGIKSHFIKIELDEKGGDAFWHFGTSQLLAVPYAFHAQTVEEDQVDDEDADPENEIQSLNINGSNLSISNGNTITLPLGEGGDNWGSQVVESNATLTGQGTSSNPLGVVSGEINPDWGNIQNVPEGFDDNVDNTEDDDADPENELQTLSIDGNNLTLSDGGGTVELPSSESSTLWQQNGNDIYYNTGNAGIGTTPEDSKLHIKGNSSVSWPHLLLEEDEADYARLTFKNTANPSKYWTWAGNCADNNNNSRMNLWYYNGSSGKDLLSISGNGNVGIGTLNPRSNLEIASSDIPQIRLNNTSTGAQNVQKITFWKGSTEKFAIGFDLWGTGDDLFTLYDTPGQIPVLNIKSGKVGIGTTSPTAKLEVLATSTFAVHGISNTNYAIVGETSGNASGILGRATNNSGCGVLGVNYDSDGCAGHFEGYLYVNGNVGVGKRPPNCRLHIKQAGNGFQNGLRLERPDNTNWWSIQINNYNDLVFDYNGSSTRAWINHSTAAYQYTSDRRLKTDIHSIESALSKVMQLNPVIFRFKTNPNSEKPSYGLIAQEVQKIYPEFVSENNGTLGIAYHNFSVVNIRAIQEQQEQIGLMEKQIEKLVNQNNELKVENARIKTENKQIVDRLEKLETIVAATANKTN